MAFNWPRFRCVMSGLGNLKQITSGGEIQASVDVSLGSFIMQKVDFLEQFFSTFLLSELKALSLSESRENFFRTQTVSINYFQTL